MKNKLTIILVAVLSSLLFGLIVFGETIPQIQQWSPIGTYLIPKITKVGTSTTVYYGSGTNLSGISGGGGGGGLSSTTPFTAGYITLVTTTNSLTNSNIFQSGLNMGIGTATPTSTLTVKGVSTNPLLGIYTSSTASALYINTNGNVGIGTTTPNTALSVVGTILQNGVGLVPYTGATTDVDLGTHGLKFEEGGAFAWYAFGNPSTTYAQIYSEAQNTLNIWGTNDAILGLNSLTTNRTFTFPDISGTFILGTSTIGSLAKWTATNTLQNAVAGTDYQSPITTTTCAAGQHFYSVSSTGAFYCSADSGGGTPAGSNTQIQYNNGGAFGGDSGLTWSSSTKILNLQGSGAYKYDGVNAIIASTTLDNWFFGNAGNLTMTGDFNTGIGGEVLLNNTTGYENTGIGDSVLFYNTTGYENTGIGDSAGRYANVGNNITSTHSLYLGSYTKALISGDTNEIVIGASSTGAGSNSVVLGNDNITKTILKGSVGIGTTTPQYKLDLQGDLRVLTSSTLGNVISGSWLGTAIGDTYISSASNWNSKITTTSLSVAYAPLSYNNTTGVFTLPTSTNSQSGFLSSADWNTFNGKQSTISFPIPVASTSLAVVSPLVLTTNSLSMPTSTTAVNGYLSATDWTNFNTASTTRLQWDGGSTGLVAATGRTSLGLGSLATANSVGIASTTGIQATISWPIPVASTSLAAGLNLVLTTNSLAATTTPAFSKIIYPDATTQTTAFKQTGFNIYNATTTPTATTTTQMPFYLAMTITQITCSTNGASITIGADERASSTPDTYGTDIFGGSLVCDSNGATTSTFSNATIATDALLNFSLVSVPNSTTTLRVGIKYKND